MVKWAGLRKITRDKAEEVDHPPARTELVLNRMDDEGSDAAAAAVAVAVDAARRWLEGMSNKNLAASSSLWAGGLFDSVCHSGLRIVHLQGGRAICRFRVPAHLTVI